MEIKGTYPDAKRRLGLRVSRLREQRGLSQRRLALMLDLDRVTLSRIEAGAANPTVETLVRIAEGLDVELEDLFLRGSI